MQLDKLLVRSILEEEAECQKIMEPLHYLGYVRKIGRNSLVLCHL